MSGVIESAAAVLSASERNLEVSARNIANVSTPGFKRHLEIPERAGVMGARAPEAQRTARRDFTQATFFPTGNPLDLAISGSGFFELRSGDALIYSRQGQFRRAADGTLVSPQGHVLQQAGGGDLVIERDDVTVLGDGTVLDREVPVARVAVLAPEGTEQLWPVGETGFAAPPGLMAAAEGSIVRQGMAEASNVSTGDEMVAMMAAIRSSEAGARLVQVYDDLMGRVSSSLGGTR